jgi:zinc and cadmium transporter
MVSGEVWVWSLLSVLIVSLISFVGVFTLSIKVEKLRKVLIYFISFSAGALLGDVFLHLLPEIASDGFTLKISSLVLGGIGIFFVLEKVIHWQHCHMPITEEHIHPFAYTNLIGDGLHNFIDGMLIVASYLVSIPVGIATTIAVILHEIPQEIGDFGVLIHGGFSKGKALMVNFETALMSVVGAIVALLLSNSVDGLERILVPLTAGAFIYIAGSDLIPELHKDGNGDFWRGILQLIAFVSGIAVMAGLLVIG